MSFSAAWLNLREPFDAQARNREVLTTVMSAFADRAAMTIVDLGCGTGSTYRALASRLSAKQRWRLYDNDLGLLARASRAPNVTAVPLDLARDLEAALDGPVDLVVTSALLDLVSDEWLTRLAVEAAARRLPVYAALTYDGRAGLKPVDRFDAGIVAAVNAHQRRDKGFGPGLGPEAARAVVARFEAVGYTVEHGRPDWVFGPYDREIQDHTLAGWATAARETGLLPGEVAGWLTRRRDLLAGGRSSIQVGHVDVFARPIGTR
jgi:SAM-dependent methyltransferase